MRIVLEKGHRVGVLFLHVLETIDNSSFREIVRRELEFYFITGQEANAVHAHFSGKMTDDRVPILEPNAKVCCWQQFFHGTTNFYEVLGRTGRGGFPFLHTRGV